MSCPELRDILAIVDNAYREGYEAGFDAGQQSDPTRTWSWADLFAYLMVAAVVGWVSAILVWRFLT